MKIKFISAVFLVFLLTNFLFPQADGFKQEAQREMQSGRYGEAIDLLNRYISAKPQESEGYNLRGLCYEKRSQYEMAVYDFRSARKLKPDNREINQNLARATDAWYKLLYNKIEGHRREIAINSRKAVNYLEIGKSYKNLGEWATAEEWYDKYLGMEEASADEIIRYTEILAKNNHLAKGEPILKRYTEKYPTDHRLWSRYGYFLLWMGKNKPAIDAFEKALALKPYFKEAMDGLDQAKGKGYIYTVNDTSYRYGKGSGQKQQEYAIDKYLKVIKNKPDDFSTRYLLVDELIKHNRIEEAYEQLLYMQKKDEGSTEKFQKKWDYLVIMRDSVYKLQVQQYASKFEKNKNDKDAALKLADAYAHLFDYDNAIITLEEYLSTVKESEQLDVRYMLTKYTAWSYQWDKAFKQANIILTHDPNNKDYQLLMSQLIAWNIIDATPEEVTKATNYLVNILKSDPNNLSANLSMAFLKAGNGEFEEAIRFLDIARGLDPTSKEVEAVENFYNTRLLLQDEKENLKIRGEAGSLVEAGDCIGAAKKYDELMARVENPERHILLEYASINTCAKNYNVAIDAYDKVLAEEFDFEVASLRAMNIMWSGDTTRAIQEFLALKERDQNNYAVNFYLGDLYERINRPQDAISVYQTLLNNSEKEGNFLDSTQIAALNTRIGYLSDVGGYGSGGMFGYVGLSPISTFYSDNQNFRFSSIGGRAEVGLFAGFSAGATYLKNTLTTTGLNRNLTTFKGQLFFRLGNFSSGLGVGRTRTVFNIQKNVVEANARYEQKDQFALGFSYEKNDARVIIYSPYIINQNYDASVLRLVGYYNLPSKFLLSSYFSYIKVSDGNAGNDFQFRGGKALLEELNIGYEFYYANYARTTGAYYSPRNFESHSLWADWKAYKEDDITLNVGGKLGYVPATDFLIKEIYGEAIYRPLPMLTFSGKVTAGSSSRYDSNYSYLAAFITGFISIF